MLIVVPFLLSDTNISGSADDSAENAEELRHPVMRIQRGHREVDCNICQNGWRSLRKIVDQRSTSFGSESEDPPESLRPDPVLSYTKSEAQLVYTLSQRIQLARCVCNRAKITTVACRRNSKSHIPRAIKYGDIIAADHKTLNEDCESRNNQRYAIVVQDLPTPWIQSHPCKAKLSKETMRNLRTVLDPEEIP